MMRLFVALALPNVVAAELEAMQSGVPGARWQTREQMHLTLRFVGEVDGRHAAAIDDALSAISAPILTLQLKGVGAFGGENPRALWAGIAQCEALLRLQRKIETAMQRIGLKAEPRKFTPHVTLARLRGTPPEIMMDYLVDHALYASAQFETRSFTLYESHLGANGSLYVPQRQYLLR
jgi:2'-5' RNA ligase